MSAWHTLGVAFALAIGCTVAAAEYPDKPVKIVVPFAAGGFTDTVARVLGLELQKKWGQPVVIDNRVGAGGNIGGDVVAKSAPDGYTLLLATNTTHAINGTFYRTLPFD